MLISIETHITCDFRGGVRTPYPPSGSAHVALFNAQMFLGVIGLVCILLLLLLLLLTRIGCP